MKHNQTGRRGARKRMLTAVLSVSLTLLTAVQAAAAGTAAIDPGRTDGSLRLDLSKLNGGEVSIYTVAEISSGSTGYFFDTGKGQFADQPELTAEAVEKLESADSQWNQNGNNATLADRLAKIRTSRTALDVQAVSDGQVSFTGLRPGLYLVVQSAEAENQYRFAPFLISLPDQNGSFQLTGAPKSSLEPPVPTDTPPSPGTPDQPTTDTKTPTTATPVSDKSGSSGSSPYGSKLPQTGQLWWPVPILAFAGLLMLSEGTRRRRDSLA